MRGTGTRWTAARVAWATGLLVCTGCMQVQTNVKLNEDGSATVTERLRFSSRILDLEAKSGGKGKFASFLTRTRAEARAAEFGKGVALKDHKMVKLAGGARESRSVYQVKDINNLQYVSPYMAVLGYPHANTIRFQLQPVGYDKTRGIPGTLNLVTQIVSAPDYKPTTPDGAGGPTPLDAQLLRELQPVFREMLEGFELHLTVEGYGPVVLAKELGLRNARSLPVKADLLRFTDRDLDNHGLPFLENEEVMLDLMRGRMGSDSNVARHVRNRTSNLTLPFFVPEERRVAQAIVFRPSRALFDRYFKGKVIDWGRYWNRNPDRKTRKTLAVFEELRYRPTGVNKKRPAPARVDKTDIKPKKGKRTSEK